MKTHFLFFLIYIFRCAASDFNKVAFIIMSQPHKKHAEIAQQTKLQIIKELQTFGGVEKVFVSHKDLNVHGAWTYFPLFNELLSKTETKIKWFVFLNENSGINGKIFKEMISKYDHHFDTFIGHAQSDGGYGGYLHRFIKNIIGYPDTSTGFIMSRGLLATLAEIVESERKQEIWSNYYIKEFTLDASYELALTILSLQTGGFPLIDEPLLCPTIEKEGCAVFSRKMSCGVTPGDIQHLVSKTLFAVKTCSHNHQERLTIIRDTWAKATKNLIYVSDSEDPMFNTTVLPGADFNTVKGHCRKTEAILEYFNMHASENNWRWLVITDDDTILSVSKLMELVHCYDQDEDDLIALGSIYGFRVIKSKGQDKFDYLAEGSEHGGFDYPAGGGGMVFNQKIVEEMLKRCKCPAPDHHDDIHIGACLDHLRIPIINNDRFHQSIPEEYDSRMLERKDPISFHKFKKTDPLKNYDVWFRKSDTFLMDIKYHDEL